MPGAWAPEPMGEDEAVIGSSGRAHLKLIDKETPEE